MADNWTKLGDVVANLVALHNAAERDERGYSQELSRLTNDNRQQAYRLAVLDQDVRALRAEVGARRNDVARLTQSLATAESELAELKGVKT